MQSSAITYSEFSASPDADALLFAQRSGSYPRNRIAMKVEKQSSPELERLGDMIRNANVGMLTTFDIEHHMMHSRPLATLMMDAEPALWFLTSISSPKIKELDERNDVCVSYVSGQDFVSVSGISAIDRDRTLIKELWTPVAAIWFPDGPDDPDLGALKVSIHHAEFWDGPSNSITHLFSGSDQSLGDHVKVQV
jgi:general stress protein 26